MILPSGRQIRVWLRAGLHVLGLVLLLYFLATADLALLLRVLPTTKLSLVAAAVLLGVPFFVLKAVRWRLILQLWGIQLEQRTAVALVCIGQYFATVTPGQAGDAVRAWYLRERGHALRVGLTSILLDRACDLTVTLAAAALGLAWMGGVPPQLRWYVGASGLGIVMLALILLVALTGQHRSSTLRSYLVGMVPTAMRANLAVLAAAPTWPRLQHHFGCTSTLLNGPAFLIPQRASVVAVAATSGWCA